MIKLSFSLKIKLNNVLLKAGREFLRRNSKHKLFHSFQPLTKKDFPPSASRIYLGQNKLNLAYLAFLVWTWLSTVKSSFKQMGKVPWISLKTREQLLILFS